MGFGILGIVASSVLCASPVEDMNLVRLYCGEILGVEGQPKMYHS